MTIAKLYQTFKEQLMPMLLMIFQKTEEKKILQNEFYEARINMIPKLDKDTKENYRQKNHQQNASKLNPIAH
jgi:UDP-glucose 6-dehydrogenase